MIYLTRGSQKLEYTDGRSSVLQFEPGTALWSPAGGMHTSQNLGAPFRVIEVELKNQPGTAVFPALDPVRIDPGHYKVVHDAPQARIIRARFAAREQVPMHEDRPNRVVVFITDAHLRIIDEAGKATELRAKAGDVSWAGASRHKEENLADAPFEVVAVELR
jgi:hypothetical protein